MIGQQILADVNANNLTKDLSWNPASILIPITVYRHTSGIPGWRNVKFQLAVSAGSHDAQPLRILPQTRNDKD